MTTTGNVIIMTMNEAVAITTNMVTNVAVVMTMDTTMGRKTVPGS